MTHINIRFLIFLFLSHMALCDLYAERYIAVIDPAGHEPGRWLFEGYERAETLKMAYEIKDALIADRSFPDCWIPVVSRSPGEEGSFLRTASFINRLGADFNIRIQMYPEEREKPRVFLYHLVFDPMVDLVCGKKDWQDRGVGENSGPLELVPLHRAHFGSVHKTRFYGKRLYDYLSADRFSRYFDCYPLKGLPLVSLVGITAPAIVIEIGICQQDKWKSLVQPIVGGVCSLLNER